MYVCERIQAKSKDTHIVLGVALTLVFITNISLQDLASHVNGTDLGLDPQLASPESPPLVVIHTRVLRCGYLGLRYRIRVVVWGLDFRYRIRESCISG